MQVLLNGYLKYVPFFRVKSLQQWLYCSLAVLSPKVKGIFLLIELATNSKKKRSHFLDLHHDTNLPKSILIDCPIHDILLIFIKEKVFFFHLEVQNKVFSFKCQNTYFLFSFVDDHAQPKDVELRRVSNKTCVNISWRAPCYEINERKVGTFFFFFLFSLVFFLSRLLSLSYLFFLFPFLLSFSTTNWHNLKRLEQLLFL